MKRILNSMVVGAALFTASSLQAQLPVSVVNTNIQSNRTWSSDTVYQLDGFVYVKGGATLTIEPGTVVQGYISGGGTGSLGTLIITKDAFINARGTACSPIVFTSAKAPGQRGAGDWGGVVLMGEARLNSGTNAGGYFTDVLEGGLTGDVNDRTYGGNNDNDSSGVLQYVRIEFAGAALLPNEEINGLTLAGVGSSTVVDHIMISHSGDDAIEALGGKVNMSHLVTLATTDDDFDFDKGFRGYLQFGVIYKEAATADISLSEGIESDNSSSSPNLLPRTAPVLSNFTQIGPKATGTPSADHQSAARIRRGSWTSIHNSVFVDHVNGLFIDGAETFSGWNAGLEFKGNVLAGMTNNYKAAGGHTIGAIDSLWIVDNANYPATASLGLDAAYNQIANPVLTLEASSLLLSGANWNFTGNAEFVQVPYRGAMDDSGDWLRNWTEWDAQNALYENGVGRTLDGLNSNQVGNYAVNFSWNATGSQGYKVEWRASGASTFTGEANETGSSITVRNLAPGNYEWKVSEFAGGAIGNSSCLELFSVNCATDISYEFNHFNAPEMGRLGRVRVFNTLGGQRRYDIYLENQEGDTIQLLDRRQALFNNLTNGEYTIYVRDAFGCAADSVGVFTINALDTAFVPNLINAPNNSPNGFRPTWNSVSGIINYQLRVVNVTDGSLERFVTGINDTAFAVTNLPTGKLYRFNVRSRYNNGVTNTISAYSNPVSRNLGVSGNKLDRGSNEPAASINVRIYPNPASEQFYVQAPNGSAISLMDMNGRILQSAIGNGAETVFYTSSMAAGVYLVQVTDASGIYLEKLIVD